MQKSRVNLPITHSQYVRMSTRQQIALILWVVREHGGLSSHQIYHAIFSVELLSTDPRDDLMQRGARAAHDAMTVVTSLEGLAHLLKLQGLLRAEGEPPIYQLERALQAVNSYFQLSLTRHILSTNLMSADPIFGAPLSNGQQNWADVFVMMPFQESLKPIYDEYILPAVLSVPLTCKRGDDFFSNQAIMDEVWSAIYHAQLCIADCSGRNPNVFYELGIAHTLGRPCILIAQSAEDIPFDIGHRRVMVYSPSSEGLEIFHKSLVQTIRTILNSESSV